MVIKAETCGFIILRPVCQYIYSFQYFFDKPIAFQLLKIIGTDAYSKFRQLLHQRVGTPRFFQLLYKFHAVFPIYDNIYTCIINQAKFF